MKLAFDTYYYGNKAKTVCLAFDTWAEKENFQVYSEILEGIEDYQSGEFYKRELPCILSLLNKIDCKNIDAILVDGYVYLDDNEKLGLGGYLFRELGGKTPIIGVAKSNFATIEKNKRELLRGKSKKPLYITSIGMELDIATENIENMAGEYRIPKILKLLDSLTRE